jgi:hypothetical protein
MMEADTPPIACSLSSQGLAERAQAWRALLRTSLRSREEIAGGLRLGVEPGATATLEQLVELERDCCAWISFELDAASVTMTAKGEGEQVLRRMFSVDPQPA